MNWPCMAMFHQHRPALENAYCTFYTVLTFVWFRKGSGQGHHFFQHYRILQNRVELTLWVNHGSWPLPETVTPHTKTHDPNRKMPVIQKLHSKHHRLKKCHIKHTPLTKKESINTSFPNIGGICCFVPIIHASASRHKREHSKTLALSTTVTWKSRSTRYTPLGFWVTLICHDLPRKQTTKKKRNEPAFVTRIYYHILSGLVTE